MDSLSGGSGRAANSMRGFFCIKNSRNLLKDDIIMMGDGGDYPDLDGN